MLYRYAWPTWPSGIFGAEKDTGVQFKLTEIPPVYEATPQSFLSLKDTSVSEPASPATGFPVICSTLPIIAIFIHAGLIGAFIKNGAVPDIGYVCA